MRFKDGDHEPLSVTQRKVLEAVTAEPDLDALEHIKAGHFNRKEAQALFLLEVRGLIVFDHDTMNGWRRTHVE